MKVKIMYAKEKEIEIDDKFKKLEKEYDDDLIEELDTIMYNTLKDDTLIRVLSTKTNTIIMENDEFSFSYY